MGAFAFCVWEILFRMVEQLLKGLSYHVSVRLLV